MNKLLLTSAMAAALGLASPGSARADIAFGEFGPGNLPATPACSTTILEGVAVDCAHSENWGPVTTTSTGPGTTELTDKLTFLGVPFGDSGLGTSNIPGACDNTVNLCEAEPGQGILVTGNNGQKISDAIVGSVDPPSESFNFFVNGVLVASGVDHNCAAANFSPGGDGLTCIWTSPDPLGVDSIEAVDATGSIVLAEVSFPAAAEVAEPSSLSLLGVALGFLGLIGFQSHRREIGVG